MPLTAETLKIDAEDVKRRIVRFIRDYVERSGANGVVIGLSGGLDSSTAAALCSLALGGDRVLGLIMPERETHKPADVEHARMVAEKFGIPVEEVDLTRILEAYWASLPVYEPRDRVSNGNLKARVRMTILYYYANRLNRLVCGTSDKSEAMVGYFTKWGDGAADIEPIMDLYKTQVRQLARHIGVPKEIVEKPPAPNLWPGQLAEEELGIRYEVLDLILYGLEHFMTPREVVREVNVPVELVEMVLRRWRASEHKRRMPPCVKLEYRTVGMDFRLPHLTETKGG